jgi:phosphoribosylformimino-5-aminoimidazole carboxamide ribotide isomerase
MIPIPAIDLKEGKCVRLRQGLMSETTIYSDVPGQMARKWESLGGELLHVVDLDGAFAGELKNLKSIKDIVNSVSIPVEVGGGIRNMESIDSLVKAGISRIIIGTKAIEDPDFIKEAAAKYKGKIVVGIDAKNGKVAVKGWAEVTNMTALELAKKMSQYDIADIIYTDIKRDGMLSGPNIEAVKTMVMNADVPVIASGGVSKLKDIKNLCKIKGLKGVVIGKALYDGTLSLREAIRISSSMS